MLRRRQRWGLASTIALTTVFSFSLINIFNHLVNVFNNSYIEYDEYGCGCPRYGTSHTKLGNQSFCSNWATIRGGHQRVLAYTIYGNPYNKDVSRKYYRQIEERLKEAAYFYEGWVVRLYHNVSDNEHGSKELICYLYCKYPHFDPCQINNLYPPETWINETNTLYSIDNKENKYKKLKYHRDYFTNNSKLRVLENLITKLVDIENTNPQSIVEPQIFPTETDTISKDEIGTPAKHRVKSFSKLLAAKMWRFLVMADPTVAEFLVRDVDSLILPREVAAVSQWLNNSTALIHSMRDHPSHNGVILAGLWGGSRLRDEIKLRHLLQEILRWPPRNLWDFDQILLRKIVWPAVLDTVLVHDSYHCRNPLLASHHRALPFPTRRQGHLFVSWGVERTPQELRGIIPCPMECRPRDHLDWIFC